ncbi:MAG: methyltransferase [Caldilineaceae bacterium]
MSEAISTTFRLKDSLYQMAWGFRISQALYVTAKLGILDLLCDGPKPSWEIANALGAHEPSLRRLLRALTGLDILTADGQGYFTVTELGKLLQTEHPLSLRSSAIFAGSPFIWQAWGALDQAVMTGIPAFNQVFGETFFDYVAQNPNAAAVFNAAMAHSTTSDLAPLLAAYDFSGFRKIVDVGGGQGSLLQCILEQYPDATGILYDLPAVLSSAQAVKDSPVSARCELVGGDMFHFVPIGGDAYILKWIIHDWSDAEAIKVLQNCRQAMSDQGKVISVEMVIKPTAGPDEAKWLDLDMLVLLTGRERTEQEFRDLYAAAGLTLTRVIPAGKFSIIEGVPA